MIHCSNCSNIAQYYYRDNKKIIYVCEDHYDTKRRMSRFFNGSCNFPTCGLYATYNYKGHKRGKYCYKHKSDDMVDNLKLASNKVCIICELPGLYLIDDKYYCRQHKVNTNCILCKKEAYYMSATRVYCVEHKLENSTLFKPRKLEVKFLINRL